MIRMLPSAGEPPVEAADAVLDALLPRSRRGATGQEHPVEDATIEGGEPEEGEATD